MRFVRPDNRFPGIKNSMPVLADTIKAKALCCAVNNDMRVSFLLQKPIILSTTLEYGIIKENIEASNYILHNAFN